MGKKKLDGDYGDVAVLAVLDAMIADMGRVKTYEALGVNSRTLAHCVDNRQVTPRLRQAVRDYGAFGETGHDQREVVFRSKAEEARLEELAQRVEKLASDNEVLKTRAEADEALLASYGVHLENLWLVVADLVNYVEKPTKTRRWGLKKREGENRPFPIGAVVPPQAGVFTLVPQFQENDTYGPAAAYVKEWRELRVRAFTLEDRVKRAEAKEQLRRVQSILYSEFGLQPPKIPSPWDHLMPDGHDLPSNEVDVHHAIQREDFDARMNAAKKKGVGEQKGNGE